METALDYLTEKHDWQISSDPRTYDDYPQIIGLRNYTENSINYDADCGGYHRAFDLFNRDTNNVPAVTHGTVLRATKRGSFGGEVLIEDYNGYIWVYGHLVRDSIKLKAGDAVRQGDIVGLQGNSNYYDNPMAVHLHLQLLPPGASTKLGTKWYCPGLQIERYNINNGDYDPVEETGVDMVAVRQDLSHNPNHGGSGNPANFVSVHMTANTSVGANAQAHANFINNGSAATWHYTVDDVEAIQHFYESTVCFHAGDGQGPGNYQSVGVEGCVNSDGDYNKMLSNMASLVADIIKRNNIPIENVVPHRHWTGKNCPTQLLAGKNGVDWNGFIEMVKQGGGIVSSGDSNKNTGSGSTENNSGEDGWKTNEYGTQYKPVKGTFKVGGMPIMSRADSPFFAGPNQAPYGGWAHPGYEIEYDELVRWKLNDKVGFVGIGYNQNGGRWYLPFNRWDPVTGNVGAVQWGDFI